MKIALICGITGQDGGYLANLLLNKGYAVYGTSRDHQIANLSNLTKLGILGSVKILSMAPNDFRSTYSVIEAVDPQEIYYLAGQTSVGLSFSQPAEALESITLAILNILEIIRLRKKSVKLFNASSSECFGDTNGRLAVENDPFNPRSPYGVAKASAHMLVVNYRNSYNIFAVNGILFNHESPLRPARFVTKKIIDYVKNLNMGSSSSLLELGNLDIYRDWGWAPDFSSGIWKMMQLTNPTDFILATSNPISLREFVARVFSCVDKDWTEHVMVNNEFIRPDEIMFSAGDYSKAGELLSWNPSIDTKEMIYKLLNDKIY
jgi:GDPmannose 4,6-dehydratase